MRTKKPYTWKEIKEFLIKELKKTKHIMTYGTIGSCNVEHDIDTIITKKPKSGSADFYKEIHNLFDKLDDYLKEKYGAKLIRFSSAIEEIEVKKLGNYSKKDLLLQVMVYHSYPQIEKDWDWFLLKHERIKNILSTYNYLIGDKEDLFNKEFDKENYYDPIFTILYLIDRIHSNYLKELLLNHMNFWFDIILRKKLGLKPFVAKNESQVREHFYKICNIVDRLEKNKK